MMLAIMMVFSMPSMVWAVDEIEFGEVLGHYSVSEINRIDDELSTTEETLYIVIDFPVDDDLITDNISITYSSSSDNSTIEPSAAVIVTISTEFNRISNSEFEFRFRINPPLLFPNPALSQATGTISTSTSQNGTFTARSTFSTFAPRYSQWYSVRISAQTAHFRFSTSIVPANGTVTIQGSPMNRLINRTGHIWWYDYTCPTTNKRITPPNTNWNRCNSPRVSSYRTTYINWMRANFDPTFTWDNKPIHHIRPYFLGGTNAVSNLIHLTTAQHTPITNWFRGY